MFKSPTSVHAEPFHSSFIALLGSPPKAKAASAVIPELARYTLAVFKSPTSVQLDPFHSSFIAVTGGVPSPPKHKADV